MNYIEKIVAYMPSVLCSIVNANPTSMAIKITEEVLKLLQAKDERVTGIRNEHLKRKLETFLMVYAETLQAEGELQVEYKRWANHSFYDDDKETFERIVITLDRLDHEYKAGLIAKLYIAYKEYKINRKFFIEMLFIVENWFDGDKGTLKSHEHGRSPHYEFARKQRLISAGLIEQNIYLVTLFNKIELKTEENISIYGFIMLEILEKPKITTNRHNVDEMSTMSHNA